MKESTVQQEIKFRLGSRHDIRLFRNNVGMGYIGTVVDEDPPVIKLRNYRRIKFGLQEGSGEIGRAHV